MNDDTFIWVTLNGEKQKLSFRQDELDALYLKSKSAQKVDQLLSDFETPVNPSHYDFPGGVQVIDITKHLDFLAGNVVKYVCRAGRKGDRMTDLLKAKQYLDWLIEKEQSEERN